jgi:hypothetical protein
VSTAKPTEKASPDVGVYVCRAIIAAILFIPVYLGARHGLLNLDDNPVLESALAGAFLIHMWTRPRRIEWASVLLIGAALSSFYAYVHHGFGHYLASAPSACAAFLGVASLAVLSLRSFVGEPARRRSYRDTLLVASVFPYFSFPLAICLNLTTAFHPKVYDLLLYAFDESLGIRASYFIGQVMSASAPLKIFGILVYQSMPLAICSLVALERSRPTRFPAGILKLFIVTGLAGAILYNFFPAAGPIFMFGNRFPASLPAVADLAIQPVALASAARNALPSVHFACALLIWWNVARLSVRWRIVAGVFLGMTILATIGFGEHYLIDLVVAVPFALAMQAACLKSTSWASDDRRVAFSGGAALTVIWIAVLRLGLLQNSPPLAWCSVVVTLALSLWWKRRLALGHRGFEQETFPVGSVILAEKS